MTHLSQSELQDFVLGIAEPSETETLRAHVSTCHACARRLEDEARFDLWLQDIASLWTTVPPANPAPRFRRAWRPAWVSAVFVTLVAGLWLYMARNQPAPIAAEDTYAPRDYCLFVGGEIDRIGLQAQFPDTVLNQAVTWH